MTAWRELPATLLGAATDVLAPDLCHLCGRPGDPGAGPGPAVSARARALARPVGFRLAGITLRSHPLCRRCAGGLDDATTVTALDGKIDVMAAFDTGETLLRVIHALKFSRVAHLAAGAAAAIACALEEGHTFLSARALLVPVPMDRSSRRRRGFNQSAEIAAALGRRLGIEVSGEVVRKVRSTPPQSATAVERRGANVSGAFAAGRRSACGRDVVIVDDIVTTGATIRACAAALDHPRSVTAVCVGRAPALQPAGRRSTPFLQS